MATKPPRYGASGAAPARRDPWRGSAASRGYDRAWQRLRAAHLADEPLCRMCGAEGRIVPATVVDHIQPISVRPELRLDDGNLQALCQAHHNARTANQVADGHRGATGRPRRG